MSPLEAAKKLARLPGPEYHVDHCAACLQRINEANHLGVRPHAPNCPVLMWPKIVAALEAAQAAVDAPMVLIEEHIEALSRALSGGESPK